MHGNELFGSIPGGVYKFRSLLRSKVEVSLDKFQNTIKLTFLEYVICACNVNHENGCCQAQSCFAIFRADLGINGR